MRRAHVRRNYGNLARWSICRVFYGKQKEVVAPPGWYLALISLRASRIRVKLASRSFLLSFLPPFFFCVAASFCLANKSFDRLFRRPHCFQFGLDTWGWSTHEVDEREKRGRKQRKHEEKERERERERVLLRVESRSSSRYRGLSSTRGP